VAEGGTIRVAAPQELSLKATPASGVTCSPTSVSIGSASISSVAVGRHVIDGAIINIK
jgi:hypothetical protein